MKKILTLCLALMVFFTVPAGAATYLVPGGQCVGLELKDDTVTVVGFDQGEDPAKAAGIQPGDVLASLDGSPVKSIQDVKNALNKCRGPVKLGLVRQGKPFSAELVPQITADGPKLGLLLKQGITGIGTITWFDPETGKFATLGHGVSQADGQLARLLSGNAYGAKVASVQPGKAGKPGQLRGSVQAQDIFGTLTANTQQGVFGIANGPISGQVLPVAEAGQIRTGPAVIRSTVQEDQVREYSVEILKIYPNAKSPGRNLLLKVTDPALLALTGGIVQGMGVSYNRDNPEKPLACRVIWGWSHFLLDFANYRIPCAGMLGHYHSMPLIKAEDEIYEGGLSTRHFNTTSNFPFSCHTG